MGVVVSNRHPRFQPSRRSNGRISSRPTLTPGQIRHAPGPRRPPEGSRCWIPPPGLLDGGNLVAAGRRAVAGGRVDGHPQRAVGLSFVDDDVLPGAVRGRTCSRSSRRPVDPCSPADYGITQPSGGIATVTSVVRHGGRVAPGTRTSSGRLSPSATTATLAECVKLTQACMNWPGLTA